MVPEPLTITADADLVALSSYSVRAGSTRVRLYDWFAHLGLRAEAQCYAGLPNGRPGTLARHLPQVLAAERRLRRLDLTGRRVILSRSASPLSRGGIERRLLGQSAHAVFDFDDAIHLVVNWRDRVADATAKFETCVRAADVVIAGNDLLAEVAADLHDNVVMIPSCIEPDDYLVKTDWSLDAPARLVWIGSMATERYLLPVLPALDRLHRELGVELKVISTGRPNPGFGNRDWIRYVPWTPASAASELNAADLAIAPLSDTPFARGKCAYKVLQYAATGLPIAGSPVGANSLALERFGGLSVAADWYRPLRSLIEATASERARLGVRAADMVRKHYSFAAWAGQWRAALDLPILDAR